MHAYRAETGADGISVSIKRKESQTSAPRQDSNLRSRLRRAVLYPLSYGAHPAPHSGSPPPLRTCQTPVDLWVDGLTTRGEGGGRCHRYDGPVTPEELSRTLVGALTSLTERGVVALDGGVPSSVTVERPKNKAHGDYATNIAQLSKQASLPPRRLLTPWRRSFSMPTA